LFSAIFPVQNTEHFTTGTGIYLVHKMVPFKSLGYFLFRNGYNSEHYFIHTDG